ncbi:hypothetical protein [Nocardioides sp. zg-1228]|uniref:hypothetical protein n=1 Tax=Nocardioides sp. zg-1228 TaxID=2763008 RepID=UPI001642D660|nr:hypothetical protein [Nocardioides sp. zg-1228]MBC2932988.1 hypothetical protein [Nocardioides sp. zg-1228]QSF56814.1 hypothetical protein JX575_14580 [Nocardioides sp. zg-1228]
MIRRFGWAIGALVGVVAGTALGLWTQSWQESREEDDIALRAEVFGRQDVVPGPVDTVQELLRQESRVAVDPMLSGRIPPDDLAEAEAVLAGSRVPARIAYLPYPDTNDVGYTASGVGPQWWTAVGEEGHYVVLWDTGSTDPGAVGLEEHYVESRTKGQPGPALVRLAEEMATWEAQPLPTEPAPPSDFDYWGGLWGGLGAAVLFGAFGVLPAFGVLRWWVGTRRRKVG